MSASGSTPSCEAFIEHLVGFSDPIVLDEVVAQNGPKSRLPAREILFNRSSDAFVVAIQGGRLVPTGGR